MTNISKTLELFGQWMTSMTDSPDKVLQNILIEEMWQMIHRCYLRKKEILKASETTDEYLIYPKHVVDDLPLPRIALDKCFIIQTNQLHISQSY